MKKFILLLLFVFRIVFSGEFSIKAKIKNIDFARISGIARVCVLTGDENFDIEVKDLNDRKCQIFGVNKNYGETEIFFKPTDSEFYIINLKKGKNEYPYFENGRVLIDDFVTPDSVKGGFWKWESRSISGLYSHTDREGYSFHRVSFSHDIKIKKRDKLVCFVFIEENSPDEIIVEVSTKYRKSYYFSFGKDVIKWKGVSKIFSGTLPEKGKWAKLEIPLSDLKENTLRGVGFYHDKGKILWDVISLNNVASDCEVIEVFKDKALPAAYFNWKIEGPFEYKGEKFFSLYLDASPSKGSEFIWEVDGKNYKSKTVKVFFKEIKDIEIKLEAKENGREDEIKHRIKITERVPEKVKLIAKFLPFSAFIRENEKIACPVKVENLSNIPFNLLIKFGELNNRVYLLPGEENGLEFTYLLDSAKDSELLITLEGMEIERKKIRIINAREDFEISGPFLKDKEGNYVVLKVEDLKIGREPLKEGYKILFLGEYPDILKEITAEKLRMDVEGMRAPDFSYKDRILEEVKFVKDISKTIKRNYLIFFFPSYEGILRTFHDEWEKGMETIVSLIGKKTSHLYFVFLYYSPGEDFSVYREKAKNLCFDKKIKFIDSIEIFGKSWENYYKISDTIYTYLPNEKGLEEITEYIIQTLEYEKGVGN